MAKEPDLIEQPQSDAVELDALSVGLAAAISPSEARKRLRQEAALAYLQENAGHGPSQLRKSLIATIVRSLQQLQRANGFQLSDVAVRSALLKFDKIESNDSIYSTSELVNAAIEAELSHDVLRILWRIARSDQTDISGGLDSANRIQSKKPSGKLIADHLQYESPRSLDIRLRELEEFAIRNAGVGVADYARSLFPELSAKLPLGSTDANEGTSPLPLTAPATWKSDKLQDEHPPAFIKRVYGEWLGHGLTRSHIRNLDTDLYRALYNWLTRPGNEMPADIDLPTKAEQNGRFIDALRADAPDGQIGRIMGDFTAREANRIRSAIKRRDK